MIHIPQDNTFLIKKFNTSPYHLNTINEKTLTERRPLLNEEEMAGLEFRLKAAMISLCDEMKRFQSADELNA